MKKFFILSMVLLVSACTGCGGGETEQQENLSWGTAEVSRENPVVPGDSLSYQISIKLDTLTGESDLARQLAAVLRDSVLRVSGCLPVSEAITLHADSIETEWRVELAEMYDPEMDFKETLQYYYSVEGSAVEGGCKDVLSYQTTTDCYLGGVHGSYVVQYYNLDKKSGKLLTIGDVVPAGKESQVLRAMEEQLCRDWDATDLDDLKEQTGITVLGDLYLTSNFLLKGDSIEFLFNQYEIAPYAAGLISVTIPSPAIP